MSTSRHPDALLPRQTPPACLAPVHPEIRKAGPSHCLAICLRNLNQPEEALECYRQALQDAPEAIYVRLEFAEFLAQRGDFVAGLTTLHQAIGDEPKNTRLWKLGGEIALRQPATRDFALDWTEESLKQAPAVPELERLRAEALMLSGQTAAAAPLWQHLAAQGNPSDVAAAVLCAVVSDAPARFSLSGDDANVSREFVQWYRKLVQFEAEEVVGRLHERLPKLSLLLPKAADLIDRVTAAALAG
ncbi:MAG: tetratricopeptide repeat protein [Verrucomicrobiota bacterium]